MWLWDIYDGQEQKHWNGDDIETFFDTLFSFKSVIIYFHNLKFDGSFMMSYLLEHGFIISDSGEHMSIRPLITDRLIWYSFTIYFNGKQYKFRDSMKKITSSLRDAAKDFELDIQKGEIPYGLHRDVGYKPTDKEISYVHTDTEICSKILEYYYDNGMTSLTNATDAMKAYKEIIGKKAYDHYFPILDRFADDFIRRSYKGGFCYLNPKFKGKDLDKVYTYDVKSMYPSRMAYEDLPWGIPEPYEGAYEYDEYMPLYIQEINVDCKLKEGHIPTIQTKSFLSIKLNYLTDTNGRSINMVLTMYDLENLLEDYDIYDIDYVKGLKFQSSKDLFYEYVMHYFNLKEQSKGAVKQLYKIFLNSLYGKFAMMIERGQAYPVSNDTKLHFDRTEREETDPVYTAVAAFITATARKHLLKGIKANIENFIYCDTDSIHLINPAVGLDLGKQLGQFDLENGHYENNIPITDINKAHYLGQKCYILGKIKNGNQITVKKIAGAPPAVKEAINFDNFKIGFESDASQYPKYRLKQVKGGCLLIPTSFTIKEK